MVGQDWFTVRSWGNVGKWPLFSWWLLLFSFTVTVLLAQRLFSRDRFQSLLFFNLCSKSLLFFNLCTKSLLLSNLCSKSLLNLSNLCLVDFFFYTFFLLKFKFSLKGLNLCFFSIFAHNLCFFSIFLAQNLCFFQSLLWILAFFQFLLKIFAQLFVTELKTGAKPRHDNSYARSKKIIAANIVDLFMAILMVF